MTKRKGNRWIARQQKDIYVKASKQDGYRSRASYKLLELQNKYKILKSGMKVVDLGAAPGGWSQVASKIIGSKGKLWALDILPIDPISNNVTCLKGDFNTSEVHDNLSKLLDNTRIDWVISDIAPNITGCSTIDQPRVMELLEQVWTFAQRHLKAQGGLLVKAFQGEGLDEYVRCLKQHFKTVFIKKPDSSRAQSKELYVLARGYNI